MYKVNRLTSYSVTEDGSYVTIEVSIDGVLNPETRYELVLAQPVPVSGYNLPVQITVTPVTGDAVTVPLKQLYDRNCGVCNIEFGQDLPECRNRVPLYYTNGNDFIDLRENRWHNNWRGDWCKA